MKNCYKYHGREDLLPEFTEENPASPPQQYTGTMVQTINNPDGSVSIIQIDTGTPGSAVVTLPDGTQATVVHAVSNLSLVLRLLSNCKRLKSIYIVCKLT